MPKTVPADYQSKVRKPDDFDAFWDDVLRGASGIPLDAEVIPDPLAEPNRSCGSIVVCTFAGGVIATRVDTQFRFPLASAL